MNNRNPPQNFYIQGNNQYRPPMPDQQQRPGNYGQMMYGQNPQGQPIPQQMQGQQQMYSDHGPQHQVNPPQLRHPQGQIPPPGYQPPHQQHLAPPFPGPSNPNLNSSSEESPKKPIMERIKGLVPAPTHLDNSGLDEMNVIQLCNVGREVTNEISIRFLNLFSCLRMPADRKTAPATDVEAIVTYIRHLTIKLVELRARIDRQRLNDKKWTDDDFFDYLTTEDDENAKQLTEKKAVMERVEENRVDIINKSNQIKKLEWLTAVMDPRHKK